MKVARTIKYAIAAESLDITIGRTAVAVYVVPVVAFLAGITGTIATETLDRTDGRAAVAVHVVPVVAFLAGIKDVIATVSATRVTGAGNSPSLNDAAEGKTERVHLCDGPNRDTRAVRQTTRAVRERARRTETER